MRQFGLIGYPLTHSFSKKYFSEKFQREGISDARYDTFPLESIEQFPGLVEQFPDLCGLNVTIPYKKAVIPYLDALDPAAEAIGAVNCIRRYNGKLSGYNTDAIGFEQSLVPLLQPHPGKALILGTGGASFAVRYVLGKLGIPYTFVSRNSDRKGILRYSDLGEQEMRDYTLIINATPVGMSPREQEAPDIPYEYLGSGHLLYDLIYNPERTLFLAMGEQQGARIKNGMEMLYLQAEGSWAIWNSTAG